EQAQRCQAPQRPDSDSEKRWLSSDFLFVASLRQRRQRGRADEPAYGLRGSKIERGKKFRPRPKDRLTGDMGRIRCTREPGPAFPKARLGRQRRADKLGRCIEARHLRLPRVVLPESRNGKILSCVSGAEAI